MVCSVRQFHGASAPSLSSHPASTSPYRIVTPSSPSPAIPLFLSVSVFPPPALLPNQGNGFSKPPPPLSSFPACSPFFAFCCSLLLPFVSRPYDERRCFLFPKLPGRKFIKFPGIPPRECSFQQFLPIMSKQGDTPDRLRPLGIPFFLNPCPLACVSVRPSSSACPGFQERVRRKRRPLPPPRLGGRQRMMPLLHSPLLSQLCGKAVWQGRRTDGGRFPPADGHWSPPRPPSSCLFHLFLSLRPIVMQPFHSLSSG